MITIEYEKAEFEIESIISTEQFSAEPWTVVALMRAALHGNVYQRYHKSITVTHPADWWQAVKQRFAPAWWLSRWPVRNKSITVSGVELVNDVGLPDRCTIAVTHAWDWPRDNEHGR